MKRFSPLLLALCFVAPHAYAVEKGQTPEPGIYKMADGLQIQSYDTRDLRDDMAEMLGIWMWKFRLSTIEKGKSIEVKLELRTPGEKPKQLGGFGQTSFFKGDFVFGVQPIGDDSIYIGSTPKIRLYSRRSSYWTKSETREPGNSHVIENPFLNLGGASFPYVPAVRADGSFLLVQFSPSGKDNDPQKSELVVVTSLKIPPSNTK